MKITKFYIMSNMYTKYIHTCICTYTFTYINSDSPIGKSPDCFIALKTFPFSSFLQTSYIFDEIGKNEDNYSSHW